MSDVAPPAPPWADSPAIAPNTLAVLSLVLGIIAAALCWIPVIDYLTGLIGVTAVVLGVLGLRRISRHGLAIGGIVTGSIGAVMSFVLAALFTLALLLAPSGPQTDRTPNEAPAPSTSATAQPTPPTPTPSVSSTPPRDTVTWSGSGSSTTVARTLRGNYTATWQYSGRYCAFSAYISAPGGSYFKSVVASGADGQSGSRPIYGLTGVPYQLDIYGYECAWSVTLTPTP